MCVRACACAGRWGGVRRTCDEGRLLNSDFTVLLFLRGLGVNGTVSDSIQSPAPAVGDSLAHLKRHLESVLRQVAEGGLQRTGPVSEGGRAGSF